MLSAALSSASKYIRFILLIEKYFCSKNEIFNVNWRVLKKIVSQTPPLVSIKLEQNIQMLRWELVSRLESHFDIERSSDSRLRLNVFADLRNNLSEQRPRVLVNKEFRLFWNAWTTLDCLFIPFVSAHCLQIGFAEVLIVFTAGSFFLLISVWGGSFKTYQLIRTRVVIWRFHLIVCGFAPSWRCNIRKVLQNNFRTAHEQTD